MLINTGQWQADIYARMNAGNNALWITRNGLMIDMVGGIRDSIDAQKSVVSSCALSVQFGTDMHLSKPEYSLTGREIKWFRGQNIFSVPSADTLRCRLSPKAELTILGTDGAAGWLLSADSPADIPSLNIQGADSIILSPDGQALTVYTIAGIYKLPAPRLKLGDKRDIVLPAAFSMGSVPGSYTIQPMPEKQGEQTLVVPLIYVRLLGGSETDRANSVVADTNRNLYIAGETNSRDFPISPGAYTSPVRGARDIFIAKYDSTGARLIYTVVIGGSAFEQAYAIAADPLGNAYLTGTTSSPDFPVTPNAFTVKGGQGDDDVFALKLSADGKSLLYSTYIVGNSDDIGRGIAVDFRGDMYVTGSTGALQNKPHTFPKTPRAFDTSYNGGALDGFVLKLSPAGQGSADLVYSTLIGGNGNDTPNSIAVDSRGQAYVVGEMASTSGFPVTPFSFRQIPAGGADGFILRLNPAGDSLLYSALLGGSGEDRALGIIVEDFTQNVFITGITGSDGRQSSDGRTPTAFPTTVNAYDTTYNGGNSDAFLMKMRPFPELDQLFFSTFLGGAGDDLSSAVGIDVCAAVYVAGYTNSTDFPVTDDAVDAAIRGTDAFVAKISSNGNVLVFSSFFGGSGDDIASGIAVDRTGAVYIAGYTESADLPGAGQVAIVRDAYVAKMQVGILPLRPAIIANGPLSFCTGGQVTLDAESKNYVSYRWRKDSLFITGATTGRFTATETGVYTVEVIDASGCTGFASIDIIAFPRPRISKADSVLVICPGDSAQITIGSPDSLRSYSWSPAGTLSCNDCPNPIAKPFVTTTYLVTVADTNQCTRTDSVIVYVLDSTALAISKVPDTVPVCPGDTARAIIELTNTSPVPLMLWINRPAVSEFISSVDSILVPASSAINLPVVFTGRSVQGVYSAEYILLDKCGNSRRGRFSVRVGIPSLSAISLPDTTVCQRDPATRQIRLRNAGLVPATLQANGTAGLFSIQPAQTTVNPGDTAVFTINFSGDTAGIYNALYYFRNNCGGIDSVGLKVIVQGTPLRLSLNQADTTAKPAGQPRILQAVVDSIDVIRSSRNRTLRFTIQNEKTALVLDSVHSEYCLVNTQIRGDSTEIILSACSDALANPLAKLYYSTVVGQTLMPVIQLLSVSAGDRCIAPNALAADTIRLLPYGCEITTISSGKVISALQRISPQPAFDMLEMEYSTVEAVPVQIMLYSSLGSKLLDLSLPMHKPGLYSARFDISSLPQGSYMLIYHAGQFTRAYPLLIAR